MTRSPLSSPLLFLACATALPAQERAATQRLLDAVIERVERNYAGFALEVARAPERLAEYREHCERMRARCSDAGPMLDVLRAYVDWFDDGHLFVQELPSFSGAELAAFRAATPKRSIEGLETRLRRPGADLDPIEGLYFTPEHEIAVERAGEEGPGYVGVIVKTRSDSWQPGHVIAEFEPAGDAKFAAVLRMDDRSPRRVTAHLQDVFLHMPPHTWGRRFPLPAHDRHRLDPTDPRAPRFRVLGDDACLVSIPSLSSRYGKKLNKLCVTHRDEITARKLLVVDLRGCSGGSSTAARPLAAFYHTDERDEPAWADAYPHVLSCPDTIAYYDRIEGGFFTPAWLRSLRKRLRERPGELIPLYDPPRRHDDYTPRLVHALPAHVAILIDGNVASAGEAFVLEARRHGRVRTFGSATHGMIDYQNVSMVVVSAGDDHVVLGYPVIAASAKLPHGGFNATGVPPDVEVGAEVADLIGWVREQYR